MEKLNNRKKDNESRYFIFAATRVVIGITFAVAALWVFNTLLDNVEKNLYEPVVQTEYGPEQDPDPERMHPAKGERSAL